jgi:hypothetical protein
MSSGMLEKRGTDVSSMANVSLMSRWLQLHAATSSRESELSLSMRLPFRRNLIRSFLFLLSMVALAYSYLNLNMSVLYTVWFSLFLNKKVVLLSVAQKNIFTSVVLQ